MFLRYSVYFLIAGLYLSSSAPTPEDCQRLVAPEDCQRLVTPLPLDDPTKIHGRWNFIAAFSDHPLTDFMLKQVDNFWMTITSPPSSNNTLTVRGRTHFTNGTCDRHSYNMTVVDNTINVSHEKNINSTFQILQTCADCLLFNINTTVKDVDVSYHTLYIHCRSGVLEESDLEIFRQQVECLGFSQPPNYQHNPKKDFCPEV